MNYTMQSTKPLDHNSEQELIRKYLNDTLTKDEELLLADLYDSDASFRDALDGLEMLSGEQFNNVMESVSNKIDGKINSAATTSDEDVSISGGGRVIQMYSLKRMAIAASIVLSLVLGGTVLMNSLPGPYDKVYASNYVVKPYPDLITRGSGDDLSQLEKTAISAYNTENYEVSVKYFKDLFTQYPENEKYGLFLGIAYMGMEEHEQAINVLEVLISNSVKYKEDISWYLGLSYLKKKEVDNAKKLFASLSENNDSYYQESSVNILKKLK